MHCIYTYVNFQAKCFCNTSMIYNIGLHWMRFTLDPNELHLIVDPVTNSIPHWHAYQLDYDTELSIFAAAVPRVYFDWDLFLPFIILGIIRIKPISSNIPPLPSKPTVHVLLPFYNKSLPHCHRYYVFVPPLSTLCSGLIMGNLSHGNQSECLQNFSDPSFDCTLSKKHGSSWIQLSRIPWHFEK